MLKWTKTAEVKGNATEQMATVTGFGGSHPPHQTAL